MCQSLSVQFKIGYNWRRSSETGTKIRTMEDDSTLLEPSLEKQLEGHKNGITSLFYSPNEHQVATSSLDNSILVSTSQRFLRLNIWSVLSKSLI